MSGVIVTQRQEVLPASAFEIQESCQLSGPGLAGQPA